MRFTRLAVAVAALTAIAAPALAQDMGRGDDHRMDRADDRGGDRHDGMDRHDDRMDHGDRHHGRHCKMVWHHHHHRVRQCW